MADDPQKRDRVRALVRDVLRNALPEEATPEIAPVEAARVAPNVAPEEFVGRDESAKAVITEDDVRGLEHGARLRIAEGARLTPLAADLVRERNIELVRRHSRRGGGGTKSIALGADHGGFALKEELRAFLAEELGHRVRDYGTNSAEAVDYPDFAHAVARAVAERAADLGIIVDAAGIGSAMTANKIPGVRAAACYSVALARNSREHNDANVLTLGSKITAPAEAREIVRAWLGVELTEDRHRRRVDKITAIERQYR